MIVWTSLPNKTKSYNYPEGVCVNVVAIWNEGYMSYHGRDLTDVFLLKFRYTNNSCREKSAETIVPNYELIWEGLNLAAAQVNESYFESPL